MILITKKVRIIIQIKKNGTDTNSDREVITIIIMIKGVIAIRMPIFNKNFGKFSTFTQEAHRSSICPGGVDRRGVKAIIGTHTEAPWLKH